MSIVFKTFIDWIGQYKGQMVSADQVELQAYNIMKDGKPYPYATGEVDNSYKLKINKENDTNDFSSN